MFARENIREKLAIHIRLWAGMPINTEKLRKYTSKFEIRGAGNTGTGHGMVKCKSNGSIVCRIQTG